jgi:UDP-N-acetylmuramyl-tripeptide synthetase
MTFKEKIKKYIPKFLLKVYHYKLALLGAMLFGFAGKNKNIKIIGVTGTSGKSTTTDLLCKILEEAKYKVASVSSIRFKIGDKEWENKYKMTMPGRMVIQGFLKKAVKAKCDFVVLEITSEGIRQFRHKFINFDTAVFTNLTPEHIESHGGFENYRNEKLKLFKITKNIHVINIDDENAKYFVEVPANKKIEFSIKDVENIRTKNNIEFLYQGVYFNLNLIGRFNILNVLAAINVAKAYGIDMETCKRGLERASAISGRMEVVSKNPTIIVDYAHTPEQLESVYKTFKDERMICVLGSCGGGRDKWKRPVLGQIAKKYCTKIFVTNEDPYDEDPKEIIEEVYKTAGDNAIKIIDRKKAIKEAIKYAKPEDVVIITGKGSEPWMCLENGKKIPWDDREIVRNILQK